MKAPKGTMREFERHPEGMCTLVCTRLIDQGTTYNEKLAKYVRKLSMAFESDKLMHEGDYAGKPFLVYENFTYSMFQNSKLCKFIEMWRGKKFIDQSDADNFDLSSLIGQSALANITHNSSNGKTYTNISSTLPLPAGTKPLAPVGDVIIFDMGGKFDEVAFNKLSDRMKEKIQLSKEYVAWEKSSGKTQPAGFDERNPPPVAFDDDLPF